MSARTAFNVVRGALLAGALALAALPATADDAVDYFRAVQLDGAGTVAKVLARGLDPNLREPHGSETGMIVAMRYDANRVLATLLADPRTDIEAASANGTTALMMAAFKHNRAGVDALLAKGAQVNRPGWTPLHFAAASGDEAIMTLLLARGAAIDARAPGGLTPLMLAAREGIEDAVKLLLAHGADSTLSDTDYRIDAAEFARRADKPWIVKLIAGHRVQLKN